MPFLGKQPPSGFSSYTKQDLTADGSTTGFTLNKNVASANDVEVFVGNVRQEPTDAYSVSGNNLTMTAAPSSGTNFYVLFKEATQSTTVPAAGTTVPGNFGASGNMSVSGDLNVDTNVLHVDSASNRVGMGVDPTTMPSFITQSIKTTNGGGLGISSDNLTDNRWIFFGHGTASSDIQRASIKNTSSDLEFHTATIKRMTIDSNGIVTKPYQPAVSAKINGIAANGTNDNTSVKVPWNYAQVDTNNDFDTTNNRFVAPVDGTYMVITDINCFGDNIIYIYKNGSRVRAAEYRFNEGSSWDHTVIQEVISLAANDYIEIYAFLGSGAGGYRWNGNGGGVSDWESLSVFLIG
jgi:hypothetical protein